MPNRDGMGPLGQGAQTGRGLGNCGANPTTNNTPVSNTGNNESLLGQALRGFGLGRGRGRGLGRGQGRGLGRGQGNGRGQG